MPLRANKKRKIKKLKKQTHHNKHQKHFISYRDKGTIGLNHTHNKNYDDVQEFKATHKSRKLNRLKPKEYYGFHNLKLRKII